MDLSLSQRIRKLARQSGGRSAGRDTCSLAPNQHGVIILAGDKSGDKRWYEVNISKAEKLYGEHLLKLFAEREKQKELAQEKEKRKRR